MSELKRSCYNTVEITTHAPPVIDEMTIEVFGNLIQGRRLETSKRDTADLIMLDPAL